MKRNFVSGLRKIASISSAIAVIASCASFTAFADKKVTGIELVLTKLVDGNSFDYDNEYVVADPKIENTTLPSKFDLRNVNGKCYVPEIRFQNPFGTCWSFGATAAAEISAAYEYGADFNKMTDEQKSYFDFSEHHTAWFAFEPIHEDDPLYPSQAGEGIYRVYSSDHLTPQEQAIERFNSGGLSTMVFPLYAAGVGPVSESLVPYTNKEGTNEAFLDTFVLETKEEYDQMADETADPQKIKYRIIYDYENISPAEYRKKLNDTKKVAMNFADGWQGAGKYYSTSYSPTESGDWTVDYSNKYSYAWQIDNASQLPDPALYGENDKYVYNENATKAIKRELNAGRAVAISFCADLSRPGQKIDEVSYLNFLTEDGKKANNADEADIWAQYTYDTEYDPNDPESVNKRIQSNHSVCIVGYDDSFPKEYFNDPNGTIGGNGAWILRNSWGSKENSVDSSRNAWGSGGSGYCYISYYDQSLNRARTFDFRTPADGDTENADGIFNHMYDHLYANSSEVAFDEDVYMANVFEEEGNTVLTDIGITTAKPNSTVDFDVYFIKKDSKDPTDGKKVLSVENTFDYAGFHCIKLDESLVIPEGQKYSIVAKEVREDGKNALDFTFGDNENMYKMNVEYYRDEYIKEYGDDLGFKPSDYIWGYYKGVINEGESFVGAKSENGIEWEDWKNVTDAAKSLYGGLYDFDNFSIRAYVKGNVMDVRNTVENAKDYYEAGDVIEGTVTIKNDVSSDSAYTIDNIKLVHNLGAISEEDIDIGSLKADESKTLKYTYTVTEEDVKAGSVTSTVNVTVDGEPYSFVKELAKNSFTVLTTGVPGKPMNVKADEDGNIKWDAAYKAESYRVAKIVNGVTYYGSKVTGTSYKFKKVPSSNYKVYVVAYDEDGNTSRSDKITVKTKDPLGYVNSVTVDESGNVTWKAAENAVSYRVGKVVNGKVYYSPKTEDTSYQIKVVPTKDYQVFIVAYDKDGRTSWGKKNVAEVGTLGTVLDPKVDKNGKVTWSAVRNAEYYYVGKSVNGKTVYSAKLTDTSYTFKTPAKSDYKLFIVSADKDGNKIWGTKINVKVN